MMLVRDDRADALGLEPRAEDVRFPGLREARNRNEHVFSVPASRGLYCTLPPPRLKSRPVRAYMPLLSRQGGRAMTAKWTPENWRSRPASQIPDYPDAAKLAAVEARLRAFPPLVF